MAKPELDARDALRACTIHLKQIGDQLDQATKQRAEHIAAADLALVRRTSKHIEDLKIDLAALEESRALLEQRVAELDRTERLQQRDAAVEQIKPALEEVCSAIAQLETQLLLAGKAYDAVLEAFERYGASYPKALPRLPWYRNFDLRTFTTHLSEALENCGKYGGLGKISVYLDMRAPGAPRKLPSVLQRELVDRFVAELKALAVEELPPRAAVNGGADQ